MMNIMRTCENTPLNWGALTELPACLIPYEAIVQEVSIRLDRFPHIVEYDSLDAAREDVLRNGVPETYVIRVYARQGEQNINLYLEKSELSSIGSHLSLGVYRVEDTQVLDAVCRFLGLEPAEPEARTLQLSWTAFIAHRFDSEGTGAADKLARFLELLGFQVITGRGYTPGPISDKVQTRLEQQALVFAVLTPGDDTTWLTQESLLAHVKGKPLFLLKEQTASFKAALLADYEYIHFDGGNIETTFIPILEGLRELGYFSEE